MMVTRQDAVRVRSQSSPPVEPEFRRGSGDDLTTTAASRSTDPATGPISSLRKAAIVLVSLEQSVASQLLSHLDRSAVELVTWEIARLDRIEPEERAAVLNEFYGLGLRRLCFVFDDLVKMNDADLCAAFHDEDLGTWALALAGASAAVRAKVHGALAAPASAALRQRLDRLGPFRLSDSETAQLEIVDRLRSLYDGGRISLPEPSGREAVLV
jgi:flagellar motor switch protein FliG